QAEEYSYFLLDQTGSMTLSGRSGTRWDDAVNAALSNIDDDMEATETGDNPRRQAVSIWTFRDDGTQVGAERIWPTATDSVGCEAPAVVEAATGFCLLPASARDAARVWANIAEKVEAIRTEH